MTSGAPVAAHPPPAIDSAIESGVESAIDRTDHALSVRRPTRSPTGSGRSLLELLEVTAVQLTTTADALEREAVGGPRWSASDQVAFRTATTEARALARRLASLVRLAQ